MNKMKNQYTLKLFRKNDNSDHNWEFIGPYNNKKKAKKVGIDFVRDTEEYDRVEIFDDNKELIFQVWTNKKSLYKIDFN